MNTKSNARDRHPPVFILMFLALVLFAVGLVNRLEPWGRKLMVGALDQQPTVLSCVVFGCDRPKQGDWTNA